MVSVSCIIATENGKLYNGSNYCNATERGLRSILPHGVERVRQLDRRKVVA